MSISYDLFNAILAMDSYNRGYDAEINLATNSVGNAKILHRLKAYFLQTFDSQHFYSVL